MLIRDYLDDDNAFVDVNTRLNQRSLRDSTIFHGVCVGEMLVLKVICDALKPIA